MRFLAVLCLVWLAGCDADQVRLLEAQKTDLEQALVAKRREADELSTFRQRREQAVAALKAADVPTEVTESPRPAPRPPLDLPPVGPLTSSAGKRLREDLASLDRELRDLDRVVQEFRRTKLEAEELEARLKEKKPD